jgi:hypothetical protein
MMSSHDIRFLRGRGPATAGSATGRRGDEGAASTMCGRWIGQRGEAVEAGRRGQTATRRRPASVRKTMSERVTLVRG